MNPENILKKQDISKKNDNTSNNILDTKTILSSSKIVKDVVTSGNDDDNSSLIDFEIKDGDFTTFESKEAQEEWERNELFNRRGNVEHKIQSEVHSEWTITCDKIKKMLENSQVQQYKDLVLFRIKQEYSAIHGIFDENKGDYWYPKVAEIERLEQEVNSGIETMKETYQKITEAVQKLVQGESLSAEEIAILLPDGKSVNKDNIFKYLQIIPQRNKLIKELMSESKKSINEISERHEKMQERDREIQEILKSLNDLSLRDIPEENQD